MTYCEFDGCNRSIEAKGLCSAHYAQRRRGSNLKPINPNRGRGGRVDRSKRSCSYPLCNKPMSTYEHYCPGHYCQLSRGENLRELRLKTKIRSIADIKAQTVEVGDCWKYPSLNARGYARIQVDRKTWLGHRLMYSWFHGVDIGGQIVHHTCANTWCVNPAHLQLAQHADNILEMLARKSYEARIEALEAKVNELEAQSVIIR